MNHKGMTALAKEIIADTLKDGNTVIVDVKGDLDLLDKSFEMAKKTGRSKDVFVLNFNKPNKLKG